MIVAVDFDGTLQINDKPNTALIVRLRALQRQGATIILWTCRDGNRLREAVQFCAAHGIVPNYVNANPPEVIRRLGYDPRKVFADVYIDDKGMR